MSGKTLLEAMGHSVHLSQTPLELRFKLSDTNHTQKKTATKTVTITDITLCEYDSESERFIQEC